MKNPFKDLTGFEKALWIVSVIVVILSFLLSPKNDWLTLISSLIGVTALIFVAKGYVLGQILTVVFAAFYGIVSYYFAYYGELITYLLMTSPIAIMSVISWIRHPYKDTSEVTVSRLSRKTVLALLSALLSRRKSRVSSLLRFPPGTHSTSLPPGLPLPAHTQSPGLAPPVAEIPPAAEHRKNPLPPEAAQSLPRPLPPLQCQHTASLPRFAPESSPETLVP